MGQTAKRRWYAMAKAKRDHRALIIAMGGKCARCEESEPTLMQVDHVHGRPPGLHNRSATIRGQRWDVRVRNYWQEFRYAPFSLQVLCRPCNEDKGRQAQLDAAPF